MVQHDGSVKEVSSKFEDDSIPEYLCPFWDKHPSLHLLWCWFASRSISGYDCIINERKRKHVFCSSKNSVREKS